MTSPNKISYGNHPSQFVEYSQIGAKRTAVLIHGGYWRSKYGCDLMHPIAGSLIESDWDVLNLEYRRIGEIEDPWTAMASDVISGISLAPENKPMVFIGHSAGGQLALWAASTTPISNLAGVVALAPLADLVSADSQCLSNHASSELFGDDEAVRFNRVRSASPLERLPLGVQQLVIHGTADQDVPLEQSQNYTTAALDAGDIVELYQPESVDHFDLIDPQSEVWRYTLDWMDRTT